LARALHSVHAVTAERFDLAWLEVEDRAHIQDRLAEMRLKPADPQTEEVAEFLLGSLEAVELTQRTLVHFDYWPGNTVWYRGRLAGIIDWSGARLGDPRINVAQCRIDLVFTHGMDVADAFSVDYEQIAGRPLSNLWFFDLYRGIDALEQYEHWLEGYHDAGLRHLVAADIGARLRAFLRRALAEARE
jgi:aminoglycoside phosphotransferase (APT) family kinase protein